MLETLLAIYVAGMIGYIIFSGWTLAHYKGTIKSIPVLIVSTFLWPLFTLLALSAGITKALTDGR